MSRSSWVPIVFLFTALLGRAADSPEMGLGAEITVSENLLRQLQFTQWQTKPFMDDGRMVTPNVAVVVTPSFGNNVQGSAVTKLNLSLSGTASTGESQRVGPRKRKVVSVNVRNDVSGHYEQEIYVDARGLSPGQSRGHTNATPHISVSNNFLLLHGLVNRIAYNKASSMVAAKIPVKMAQMDEKVTGGLHNAVDQAGHSVARILADAGQVMLGEGPKNTQLRFNSTTGPKGALTSQLFSTAAPGARKPRPTLDFDAQAVTKSMIHQDVVANVLNQRLAGKEVKFAEFHLLVCGTMSIRALDFCKKELPEETKNTSILFSTPKAVDFVFDKGKIIFKMHARYRKLDPNRSLKPASAAIAAPTEEDVSMETEPYTVEVAYKMGSDGADLESLKVVDVEPKRAVAEAKAGQEKSGAHLFGSVANAFQQFKGNTIGAATKIELTKQFTKLFKPKVEFGPVSFPTKVVGGDRHIPTMLEAGTLMPLEVKLHDGWLGVGMGFCGEGFQAVGLTPQLLRSANGGPPSIFVKNVAPNSPAALVSLRPGDRIDSYGVPGERMVNVHRSSDEFIDFTRKRASAGLASADRTLEVSGTDASGKRFTRTIAMCPYGYDHRGKAQPAFAKLRKR